MNKSVETSMRNISNICLDYVALSATALEGDTMYIATDMQKVETAMGHLILAQTTFGIHAPAIEQHLGKEERIKVRNAIIKQLKKISKHTAQIAQNY